MDNVRKRKHSSEFEHNEHGHIVLAFTGLRLTGVQEYHRLTDSGFGVSDWARSCLLSGKISDYNKKHQLADGKRYRVALMPTWEIKRDSERTTENLHRRGLKHYGYKRPLAGSVPRILDCISGKQMKDIGLRFIAAPHALLMNSAGDPFILYGHRGNDGLSLNAFWNPPNNHWDDDGAFAFSACLHG